MAVAQGSQVYHLHVTIAQKSSEPQIPGTLYIYRMFVDITAGGDFLGLCDQKSPYKRVRFWTVTEL